MKALKIILFIVAVLILLFIVLGFIGPKTYDVNRSMVMEAPVEMVYGQVSDLSNMVDWDPWKEQLPDMKTTIHGSGHEVGSYRRWESTESVGEEWLLELVPNKSVETELKFIEPFEMSANGYYNVKSLDGAKTELIMGFKGENTFMGRAMSMIPGMSMESNVGPMFEKGLQNLSEILVNKIAERESSKEKMKGTQYAFGVMEMPEKHYIVKRAVVPMSDISIYYEENFKNIYTALGAAGREPAGVASGIYYSWDEGNSTSDMCAAVPVSNSEIQIEGYETVTIPTNRVAKLAYNGDYEGSMAAHLAMGDYLKANDLEQNGPVIEEYVVGPNEEPDASKWLTNIFYLVK